MTDVFTKAKRSAVMGRIRGAGNKDTELRLIGLMRAAGIRGWRRKAAVFVDGCFWHGCPVHGTQPKQNGEFWRAKIAKNRARDRLVNRELRKAGWRVLRVWEHGLTRKRAGRTLGRIRRAVGEKRGRA